MRPLLPPDLDVGDEHALHRAYAPPRRDWVRANFISSADGAVSLDGTAGGLGSPADQQVLAILRAHADVVIAGSATVRAENYGSLRHTPARTALRREAGLADVARLAVVSRSFTFTGDERWITEAPQPPLLLTGKTGAREIAGAETVVCGEDGVDPARALEALRDRGLLSVLYEGGPTIFADFAEKGRLDELCLTISPTLAGPGAPRIVAGPAWDHACRGRLTQVLEDGGLLFTRYAFTD